MIEEKRWISSEDLFSAIAELLAEQKQAVFTVTGMSMWPFICHGRDQVVVEACNSDMLKKGDIILWCTPSGKYLLHRITTLSENCFETTGDGNCFRDGIFPRSCIKARVVKIIRKEKTIDCSSPFWKIVFHIWMWFFPLRKWLLKLLRKISQLKRKRL